MKIIFNFSLVAREGPMHAGDFWKSPFGQSGVEAVLTILRRELEKIMRQAGTPSIRDITRTFVIPSA